MIGGTETKAWASLTRTRATAQGSVDLWYSHFLFRFMIFSHTFGFYSFLANVSIIIRTTVKGHLGVICPLIHFLYSGLNS